MIIRQSSLSAFSYCAMRQAYEEQARANGESLPRLSATIYGSVIHFALMVLQQGLSAAQTPQERKEALNHAIATFDHYWMPDHTAEICEGPPTVWIKGQTWHGLKNDAHQSITGFFNWRTRGAGANDLVLAVEHTFNVDVQIENEWHTLHGTVDVLSVREHKDQLVLSIDDFKSGARPTHLQYANQWSMYAYASTSPQFWAEFAGIPAFEQFENRLLNERGYSLFEAPDNKPLLPRRGRWFTVSDGDFSVHDCGERTEQHYARLQGYLREYVKARSLNVHPFTTETAKCAYCHFNTICGSAPLPVWQTGVDDNAPRPQID